jgi:hypothetical protein
MEHPKNKEEDQRNGQGNGIGDAQKKVPKEWDKRKDNNICSKEEEIS